MIECVAKNVVLEAIEKRSTQNGTEPGFHSEVADMLMQDVKAMPALDVAQVKHAHWVPFTRFTVKCSACGRVLGKPYIEADPYCGRCGAKMDEEEETNV